MSTEYSLDGIKYYYNTPGQPANTAQVAGTYYSSQQTFTMYPTITPPDGTTYNVTSINSYAFKNNDYVTGFVIKGNTLEVINEFAFNGCALSNITLNDACYQVAKGAFGFTLLESISFGSGLTIIDDDAFNNVDGITTMDFGGTSVTPTPPNFLSTAFSPNLKGKPILVTVTLDSDYGNYVVDYFTKNFDFTSSNFVNPVVTDANNVAYGTGVDLTANSANQSIEVKRIRPTMSITRSPRAFGDIVISPIITYKGEKYDVIFTRPFACAYTTITSVVFPISIELIGRDGFRDCSKLTKIVFSGVRTSSINPIVIEKNAFLNLPTKLNSSTPLTLYTSPLSSINHVYDYFYKLYGDTINYSETPCFKEDTKILTDKGYVAIQDLRKGDMVKTLHDDYKAIAMIGSEEIHHNSKDQRNRNQLFKYSSTNHPEVFEDLVITGGHSVLVDSLHENEEKETKQWINECDMKVDNKCRLLAFVDETCDIYEIDGLHTIYHFALEGDYHKNYGVYANGLLVEACNQYYLNEHSSMTLIE